MMMILMTTKMMIMIIMIIMIYYQRIGKEDLRKEKTHIKRSTLAKGLLLVAWQFAIQFWT